MRYLNAYGSPQWQASRCALKAGKGYHASTHSLDRLIRFASLIADEVSAVFPRTNKQEKGLFTLLQKAYTHTLYKKNYTVTSEDLLWLTEKVWQLHDKRKQE